MALLIGGGIGTGALALSYIVTRSMIGGCPSVDLQADFSVDKYMGQWFEFERSQNIPFEKGQQCINAIYTLDGARVNVKNTAKSQTTG